MKYDFLNAPTFLVILTALIGLFRIKYLNRFEYLIILILFFNIIVDLVAIKMSSQFKNNSFLYNLLIPAEIVLTMLFYYQHLPIGKIKKIVVVSMFAFLTFSIINSIFIQDFFLEFDNYTFFIGGILVSFFSYFIWRNEINNNVISPNNLILWFAAANFMYYTTTIPILSAHNWLSVYSKDMAFPIYTINKVVYGIWAIIIGIGLLWKRQTVI